jgi:enoyl-CoA hydratase
MKFENLLTEIENGILTITINRPDKLNALNEKTVDEIASAFKDAAANNEVKAIILTGAGQKAFVAGADIAEFIGRSVESARQVAQKGHDIFKTIENLPKPVIAAVNGFALGGGCEISMACHLRVASENAKFGQPEVNLGIIAGYGGTQRLIQYIGKTKAMELHMTADMITAQEALTLGLVNYVVPQDQLIAKCKELLNKIMGKPPLSIGAVIKCVNAYFEEGEDGFKTEVGEFANCFTTEDFKEGTSAFIEKRKAVFKGK